LGKIKILHLQKHPTSYGFGNNQQSIGWKLHLLYEKLIDNRIDRRCNFVSTHFPLIAESGKENK